MLNSNMKKNDHNLMIIAHFLCLITNSYFAGLEQVSNYILKIVNVDHVAPKRFLVCYMHI